MGVIVLLLWSGERQKNQETENSRPATGRAAGAEHRPLAPKKYVLMYMEAVKRSVQKGMGHNCMKA